MEVITLTSGSQKILCNHAKSLLQKSIGLMFHKKISPLLIDFGCESRKNVIHTFFMLHTIDLVFIDSQNTIVDIRTAKPFRPIFRSKKPAQYCLEIPSGMGRLFTVGKQVHLK